MAERAQKDGRWHEVTPEIHDQAVALTRQVEDHYLHLHRPIARLTYSSVHDVAVVDASGSRYALKLYRPGARTSEDVEWEVELHRHLLSCGADVPNLVAGASGFVERIELDGTPRMAVLSEWAHGAKPSPSRDTYRRLGREAATIHAAADSFQSSRARQARDMETEVHQQLDRLRPLLEEVNRWDEAASLGERLEGYVSNRELERGICHVDLTLDNVHTHEGGITVFDFDSAGEHWRAWEPQGVFHFSVLSGDPWWQAWLDGYGEIRTMRPEDQEAVPYFVLMAEFENTAWKLGLTPTSVGTQMRPEELGNAVNRWRDWANSHLSPT